MMWEENPKLWNSSRVGQNKYTVALQDFGSRFEPGLSKVIGRETTTKLTRQHFMMLLSAYFFAVSSVKKLSHMVSELVEK